MESLRSAYLAAQASPYGEYLVAAAALVGLVLTFTLAKRIVLRQLKRISARTPTDLDDLLVELVAQIGPAVFILVALYAATAPLDLAPVARNAVRYALVVGVTIRAVLMGHAVLRYGVKKFYQRARPGDPTVDAMTKTISGVLGAALWALGFVFVLDNFGFDITTLVAGLGIGGIAVAMASQTLLGDLFSAIAIFVDRPFEVGDFIIVDDYMGSVEYIGLKTTRIRSLWGEQVVFSNADLTRSRVKNYKRMETRRVVFTFGVPLDTPIEKVRRVPELASEVIRTTRDLRLERSHFLKFGEYAFLFEAAYYVLSPDYTLYMDRQQEINLRLAEAFEREGVHFAIPAQTLRLGVPDGAAAAAAAAGA